MAETVLQVDGKTLYLLDMTDFRVTTQAELAAFILEYDGINVPSGDSDDKVWDLTNWVDSFDSLIPGTIINNTITTKIPHYFTSGKETYRIQNMGFSQGILYKGEHRPFGYHGFSYIK